MSGPEIAWWPGARLARVVLLTALALDRAGDDPPLVSATDWLYPTGSQRGRSRGPMSATRPLERWWLVTADPATS